MIVGPDQDFVPGNPAKHVIGPDEERSARYHAPLPRKPRAPNKPTARSIERSIRARIAELEPLVREHADLTEALTRLQDI